MTDSRHGGRIPAFAMSRAVVMVICGWGGACQVFVLVRLGRCRRARATRAARLGGSR